jgi:hypothetical protein
MVVGFEGQLLFYPFSLHTFIESGIQIIANFELTNLKMIIFRIWYNGSWNWRISISFYKNIELEYKCMPEGGFDDLMK